MTVTAKEKEQKVLACLIGWGERQEAVRAMILTSSRANPNFKPDAFSDFDVIVAVRDIQPFLADDSWLGDFGEVLVVYRDPLRLWHGFEEFGRITQYEDGLKIDFTICPVDILHQIARSIELEPDLDIGYSVLLDKDGLTIGWKPPTYQAYIPAPPTETAYREVIEEFFHESTYLAKSLWRGELMPVKYFLDQMMKQDNLLKMLEWRMEIDHGWSAKTGVFGKGLKKKLPPELWAELESTYVGAGEEENWQAMFWTIDLFRKVAVSVGENLGYIYPYDLDRRIAAYLRKVKDLDRNAEVLEF